MREIKGLPLGTLGNMKIAPWGTVGFSFSSARSPSDAYSVDPATLAVTRWTQSETGGLDPQGGIRAAFGHFLEHIHAFFKVRRARTVQVQAQADGVGEHILSQAVFLFGQRGADAQAADV